jgi:predicted  nucleic acid-binding Zn-ribbon protein
MEAALVGAGIVEVYKDGRSVVSYIRGKIYYAKDLEDNYKTLKEATNKLSTRRNDMKNAANRDMTKQLTKECKRWIERVKKSEEMQILGTVYEKKYKNRNGNSGIHFLFSFSFFETHKTYQTNGKEVHRTTWTFFQNEF